jgi:hypothetical protein
MIKDGVQYYEQQFVEEEDYLKKTEATFKERRQAYETLKKQHDPNDAKLQQEYNCAALIIKN